MFKLSSVIGFLIMASTAVSNAQDCKGNGTGPDQCTPTQTDAIKKTPDKFERDVQDLSSLIHKCDVQREYWGDSKKRCVNLGD